MAWNFFQKFWAVLDFLRKIWHGSQTSIFVSREKIPEEIIFFILLFRVFFGFWAKIFSEVWPKNFKKFSKLSSKCPEEQFVAWIFFCFESLRIFCRNLRHGSQTSIFVSRVKVPEELYFYFSFQNLFGFWAKIFPDFWPENFKKFSKLTSKCPEEPFVAWIFFLKFWIASDFLQKP